jgi:MYXO-CTERM domain-containing protein
VGTCGIDGSCAFDSLEGCCLEDTDCDDGDACTVDTCSEAGGSCARLPIEGCCPEGTDCSDPTVTDETPPGDIDSNPVEGTNSDEGCAASSDGPTGRRGLMGWLLLFGALLLGTRRRSGVAPSAGQ